MDNHRCTLCLADARDSKLFVFESGQHAVKICAGCYFIAIDLGYMVVYNTGHEAQAIPGNLVL